VRREARQRQQEPSLFDQEPTEIKTFRFRMHRITRRGLISKPRASEAPPGGTTIRMDFTLKGFIMLALARRPFDETLRVGMPQVRGHQAALRLPWALI